MTEFADDLVDLLLSGLSLRRCKFSLRHHVSYALSHGSDPLIEHFKKFSKLDHVIVHVHSVPIFLQLISVVNMKHLCERRSIDCLVAILENWYVSRGVCLLELWCMIFAFEHIDFNILVIKPGCLAIEKEGTAVRIQAKADNIDLIGIHSFEGFGPIVSLVFTESGAHILSL